MEERDLKKLIAESREIAEALDEFADKLSNEFTKIKKNYAESEKKTSDDLKKIEKRVHEKYSNNGFPYFIGELTEDDLEKREGKK